MLKGEQSGTMMLFSFLFFFQISAFHFCPLRFPITAVLDLSYGETEMALGESHFEVKPLKIYEENLCQYASSHRLLVK